MKTYQIIESVLAGIFGNQIGHSDEEAVAQLKRDLSYQPFRDSISKELAEASTDKDVSWQKLLRENDVCEFDTEDEAREFVQRFIYSVVFGRG